MKTTLLLTCLVVAATALPYQQNSLSGFTPGPNVQEDFGVRESDFASNVPQVIIPEESSNNSPNDDEVILKNEISPAFSKSIADGQQLPAFGALVNNEGLESQDFASDNSGKQADSSFNGYNQNFEGQDQTFDGQGQGFDGQGQGFDANFGGDQQQSSDSSFSGFRSEAFEAPLSGDQQPMAFDNSFSANEPASNFDGNVQQQSGPEFNVFPAQDNSFNNNQQISSSNIGQTYNLGMPQGNGASSAGLPFGSASANSPVPGPYNIVLDDDADFYLRTALPSAGYQPTRYTSLDLAQVNFQGVRNSGHKEYITVKENDYSGETEVYRLVGVAPSSAVQGGAAQTYSANIASTVPIYRELDDDDDDSFFRFMGSQPNFYSAQGGSARPMHIRAEATLAGNNFAVLLDD